MAAKRYRFTPRGRLLTVITKSLIVAYRATGGLVGGRLRGLPGILLTTTGRRSGARRTVHLPTIVDGADLLVVASFAGNERHPAWYLNLVAHPRVEVQRGRRTFAATASPVEGEERERLWARIVEIAPYYADYQRGLTRLIPVVRLVPDRPGEA